MSALVASIGKLERMEDSCARLSIWHIRAYIIGIQTALRSLDVDTREDDPVSKEFNARLRARFGDFHTESHAIWLAASSPKNSADIFVSEWSAFSEDRKLLITGQSRKQIDALIDLTGLLPSIRAKPRLYFTTPDITYLRAWFDGVQVVASYYGTVRIQPDIKAFEEWLRRRDGRNITCPWDMILTEFCGGDSSLAFARFFEELCRFETEIS